jgi:tetratricopeptide (TPR) repeat protein/predicted Ser/Thr protein kinase
MDIKCPKCHAGNPATVKFCGECGTPLSSLRDVEVTETIEAPKQELTRGTTFAGRYEIIEELGKGGMGRVYRVEDIKLGQEVALKLIKPEVGSDKRTIERFRNELKTARNIRHKNVCGMYDLGEEQGTHYITMEYIRGEDLKSLIRKIGQLSPGQLITIAKQVCDGLVEAHRLGVIHRDLKPQNVMIDTEGNARIMDFGIARSLEAKGITGTGIMIGTPEYMSPEQVEGKEVDPRSDVYSLGVILYEMATGRVPFEGETPFVIGMKHKGEMPKDPRELNSQIPKDLSQVILRCLEKDKGKRYQSAAEVRSELAKIEEGIPTTERVIPARTPLTSRQITVQFSLKKLFVPGLALVAVVVIGLILWQVLPKKRAVPLSPTDKPSLAILYFENNTGDAELDHWRKGLAELLITDLGQSKYFQVLSGDRIYDILRETDLLEAKSYSTRDLDEIASRGGARYILRGGYTKAADTFRLNISLQDVEKHESIGSETVTGQGEGSLYGLIDELTKRIKGNFQLSNREIAADIDKEVGTITSRSPEAYRYYSEARKNHLRYDNQEAIPLYEKAISIDPEFAMAYRGLAAVYSNMRNREKFREYIQKAFELSGRISERERYQIQGQFYRQSEKTYDKAIEASTKLLEIYPDDTLGNNNLGMIYTSIEEWDKALECYKVCLAGRKDILNTGNVAVASARKGLYDEAIRVWEDYLQTEPDAYQAHARLGWCYLFHHRFELALEEAEKAFLLNPRYEETYSLKGDAYYLMGNFRRAEEEYRKIFELSSDKSTHFFTRFSLAGLFLVQGKIEKAKLELEQAVSLADELKMKAWRPGALTYRAYLISLKDPVEANKELEKAMILFRELDNLSDLKSSLNWQGLLFIRMGSLEKARRVSKELKEMIEKGMNQKLMRLYYQLEGAIELENKNYARAIEYFSQAVSLLPSQSMPSDEHAYFMEPLASAYYRSGDLDRAREEYEKITTLTSGRAGYGDIYARSFYMLGKICEQQGDRVKATENYGKFLDLWKDADPGFPEVEDARKRLAALGS